MQRSVSPCPAVMYGSDLWTGGNTKRRHVGNQTAVYGERDPEPGSDKSTFAKYTSVENNNKTPDTLFTSHCLDVYLTGRKGIEEDGRGNMKCVLFMPFMQ